jgi:SAM-dependent methyltransferase
LRYRGLRDTPLSVPEASDPGSIVETGYDIVADRYAALEAEGDEWPRMRWLGRLLDRVDQGARVLDLGCGNGVPATRAIAARHEAIGVDLSAGQIERAKRNVPDAEFIRADLTEIEFSEPFAAIAAFYVIEHLPRERHPETFERFYGWLRRRGYLLFTIEPDDEPGIVGEWLGQPMFFSQYSAERTLELVREAGFEVLETAIEAQLEGTREVSYLWVLAQRD